MPILELSNREFINCSSSVLLQMYITLSIFMHLPVTGCPSCVVPCFICYAVNDNKVKKRMQFSCNCKFSGHYSAISMTVMCLKSPLPFQKIGKMSLWVTGFFIPPIFVPPRYTFVPHRIVYMFVPHKHTFEIAQI